MDIHQTRAGTRVMQTKIERVFARCDRADDLDFARAFQSALHCGAQSFIVFDEQSREYSRLERRVHAFIVILKQCDGQALRCEK
jgi:hypothetical protein